MGSTGKGGAARCCAVRAAVYLAAATAPGVVDARRAPSATAELSVRMEAFVDAGSVGVAAAADEAARTDVGLVDEKPRTSARPVVFASRIVSMDWLWGRGRGGGKGVEGAQAKSPRRQRAA